MDVIIGIRSNFFYTWTVPCELWHLHKGKPEEQRRDQVLMIDLGNIHRKVTRKIYDFNPEQLANLTAIVWLHRGQTDRFLTPMQSYLDRTIAEVAAIGQHAGAYRKADTTVTDATGPFPKPETQGCAQPAAAAPDERRDHSMTRRTPHQ